MRFDFKELLHTLLGGLIANNACPPNPLRRKIRELQAIGRKENLNRSGHKKVATSVSKLRPFARRMLRTN